MENNATGEDGKASEKKRVSGEKWAEREKRNVTAAMSTRAVEAEERLVGQNVGTQPGLPDKKLHAPVSVVA
ncbi:MAG: hypothetical protein N2441_03610 [Rhodocyclaceae bacterium]|nr:hypothetical protein [Rhodocyclaceae bacterium]